MDSNPDASRRSMIRALTPLEARVLGVLVEKQHTVPDTYPLSLNALTAGCNQKSARSPVMNVTEPEILTAIDALKHLSLVIESSARVPRFEQNINRVLGIPSQASALLATLFLRGPQTAAELRLNSARLHSFADISSVEAFLEELAAAEPPFVTKLRRAPGARENRWMHLLCGEVSDEPSTNEISGQDAIEPRVSPSELDDLRVKQMQLEAEVSRLRKQVEYMATQLGIAFEDDSRYS
ncbi:YceH family protein [Trinickia sp. LjRoot230]|uniref:YceH family protein n=1 Tax=Trinickia sp. LjRoot230 TaxID=3342288 RepID=UPI003ED0B3E2